MARQIGSDMSVLIIAFMLILLIRLFSILFGGVFKTLDRINTQILSAIFKRNTSQNAGLYGGHSEEKSVEQQHAIIIDTKTQLDMFELNRLNFEHAVDHSINNKIEYTPALQVPTTQAVREIIIRVCDQVFVILERNAGTASIIQELLNEVQCATSNVNISICTASCVSSSGVTLDPRAAIANIRQQIKLAAMRENEGVYKYC